YVGMSSVLTIWGNKLAPGLMDRFLAKTAVSGQQTPEREDPDRADNLWQTVKGDLGARGRFSSESHDASCQLWMTTNRTKLGLMAGAAILAGVAFCATQQRRHDRHRYDDDPLALSRH
ncbi:short-chain dehydrogenase, partial [Halomonas sp. BBD48]|nr:short-chain dehydrogenase [Halomonas sp. BBD48]